MSISFRDCILLFVSYSGMKRRGSTCELECETLFRNLHVDSKCLSKHYETQKCRIQSLYLDFISGVAW